MLASCCVLRASCFVGRVWTGAQTIAARARFIHHVSYRTLPALLRWTSWDRSRASSSSATATPLDRAPSHGSLSCIWGIWDSGVVGPPSTKRNKTRSCLKGGLRSIRTVVHTCCQRLANEEARDPVGCFVGFNSANPAVYCSTVAAKMSSKLCVILLLAGCEAEL